jgi:multiple sugar transport system substrate-binding protein
VLGSVLDWATNVGFPGYATAAIDEVFNTFVIPTMFARVARDQATPEEAAREADQQIGRIFERWNRAGSASAAHRIHSWPFSTRSDARSAIFGYR